MLGKSRVSLPGRHPDKGTQTLNGVRKAWHRRTTQRRVSDQEWVRRVSVQDILWSVSWHQ
jgi:hypothetical protein